MFKKEELIKAHDVAKKEREELEAQQERDRQAKRALLRHKLIAFFVDVLESRTIEAYNIIDRKDNLVARTEIAVKKSNKELYDFIYDMTSNEFVLLGTEIAKLSGWEECSIEIDEEFHSETNLAVVFTGDR